MSEETHRVQYIRRIQEGTRRYTHDLLTENERLRSLLAESEAENGRLGEKLNEASASAEENAALKSLVAALERDKVRLQERLLSSQEEWRSHETERQRLQRSLARVEEDNRRHAGQHSLIEQQNSDLANLYVAASRIQSALDRDELIGVLQEIVANVIGCEESVILERKPGDSTLHLAGVVGLDPEAFRGLQVGAGIIGGCAKSGDLFVGAGGQPASARPEDAHLSACIPLKFQNEVCGVIALFRLLPQKVAGFEDLDREVFELLSTSAACAWYCSSLYMEKRHHAA